MLIRPFQTGDEAALYRVHYSAIHQVAVRDYTAEQINAWAPPDADPTLWAERMHAMQPFVAEIDGQIAGYADVQPSGHIVHFFVSGDFPRQGVGRALMERIHAKAQQLGLTALTSDVSRTAQPFFAHFGFHIVEERFPVRLGVTIPNALMRKAL
ncbi:GNAT family N-acetyltransferase [Rhodoferax saidenbachensis]|uniref:GNAT family N-acetyltransferase n=1 Tax=Rhodoferax saidenbachensis TaxID=1484693 RepID=A0A1P8K547_9BURK|nr:GNAT family N-acetyltransferase [Rhodoferax saidenbachensis]APW41122.1 GNAT family N-acetyltransferase [Rhodoferax saidenbachensis]